MKEIEKWVDVRKKQVREVKDIEITIVEDKELNAYITLKEAKDVSEKYIVPINGKWITKLDKNYTIMEYTPLDKPYNVRVHINDKQEILEYYFDITMKNEIRIIDGKKIPFYNDLYLDVVYYTKTTTRLNNGFIYLDDRDELKKALEEEKIDEKQYKFAYDVANSLMEEILEGKNKFINRGIEDYLKYRKIEKF